MASLSATREIAASIIADTIIDGKKYSRSRMKYVPIQNQANETVQMTYYFNESLKGAPDFYALHISQEYHKGFTELVEVEVSTTSNGKTQYEKI